MQEAELRRQCDAKKLDLRQISSVDDSSLQYPWPRGPLRTSRESVPGRIYFLQAFVPLWRIYNLGTVTHPGGEPSGVVPGIAASDCGPRSSQRRGGEGLNCFSFYLYRVHLIILQDFCPAVVQAKVLYVIVPTVKWMFSAVRGLPCSFK
jgi:hypothetical protein